MVHSENLFKIITALIWPRTRTLHLKNCWKKAGFRGRGSTFWSYWKPQPLWVVVYQYGTSWLDEICPLFPAEMLQICQIVGFSCTHVCGGGASDYPRWALAGPFLNFIHFLVQPHLVSFGYILAKWGHWSSWNLKLLCQNWLVCRNIHIFLHIALKKKKCFSWRKTTPQCFTVAVVFSGWFAVFKPKVAFNYGQNSWTLV